MNALVCNVRLPFIPLAGNAGISAYRPRTLHLLRQTLTKTGSINISIGSLEMSSLQASAAHSVTDKHASCRQFNGVTAFAFKKPNIILSMLSTGRANCLQISKVHTCDILRLAAIKSDLRAPDKVEIPVDILHVIKNGDGCIPLLLHSLTPFKQSLPGQKLVLGEKVIHSPNSAGKASHHILRGFIILGVLDERLHSFRCHMMRHIAILFFAHH